MSNKKAAEMDAFVDEARAVPIESEIAKRKLRLKRAGTELVGPCPVCGGDDRFGVNPRKGVFNCRGSGKGGDVIALVEYLDATDFIGACETLTGRKAPKGESSGPDEAEIARREARRIAAAAERERGEIDYREQERARMRRFWKEAGPVDEGSPVALYLAGRGLPLPNVRTLRCLADHPYYVSRREGDREVWHEIWRGPAMMAAIVDSAGVFRGGHVTWIDPETFGKAEIVDPESGEILKAKKVRGSLSGNHIMLSTTPAARRLVIGEGIETVLSVRLALAERKPADWMAETLFWSSISLGNLGGRADGTVVHPTEIRIDARGAKRRVKVPGPVPLEDPEKPALMPPDGIDEIILLGDGDSDRFATELVLQRAAARWAWPGRIILAAWAPAQADFNDILRAAA
ncbi:DUF7146 domain-containing protein [Kaistia sp. MMO-174]|uniref:DUF7146 domain-containing protein n=1 Tax=Kaistia sp. MMO-174 TaxID=3081256 RepID=UPI003015DF37